ncbi:MAG TPA: hypothetical protein VGW11_03250 [Solirubrobacteraceae bacterium]|nr:hypothetical protein [Solirubrobacteraceae bacterium]
MTHIERTRLQGIGVRHDFTVADGTRIGMITYDAGGRELLLYDQRDPDECRASLALDEDDARTLAELLGGWEGIDRHRPDTAA